MQNQNHKVGDNVVVLSANSYWVGVRAVWGKITVIEPVPSYSRIPGLICIRDESTGWNYAARATDVWRIEA